VDLTSAAEGLGLGLGQKHARSADSDFEPRTDIFDTPHEYTVHVSLPGAKKSDIGVDWDGDHSVLRIAGVVHRPGVDEEMMARLVVDGRKRETGVFEKTIRLGTPRAPAAVDVEAISAKMVDGVLVVRVPKAEKQFAKKQVRVGSASPAVSAGHDETYMDAYMNEKDLLFDADEDMYDGAPEQHHGRSETVPAAEAEVDTKTSKGKQREAEEEAAARERDDRSETIGVEYPHANATATAETLPRYEIEEPAESKLAKEGHQTPSQSQEGLEDDNMSDWEKDGSEDEGEDEGEYEYVKINVD
jgi:HSP20 family molecular chaperone IbpA